MFPMPIRAPEIELTERERENMKRDEERDGDNGWRVLEDNKQRATEKSGDTFISLSFALSLFLFPHVMLVS